MSIDCKKVKVVFVVSCERRYKTVSLSEISGVLTLDKFYGSSAASLDENEDLATVVKRRRILAARAAEMRHVRERQERMRSVDLSA